MRSHRTQCRCLKRFSLCIIAVGLLPILIVYFLVSDQLYYRIKRTNVDVSIACCIENQFSFLWLVIYARIQSDSICKQTKNQQAHTQGKQQMENGKTEAHKSKDKVHLF